MSSRKNKDLVELYPNVFVPKKQVDAHKQKMTQEAEALEHPDQMSPKEEEEWEIANNLRDKVKNLEK